MPGSCGTGTCLRTPFRLRSRQNGIRRSGRPGPAPDQGVGDHVRRAVCGYNVPVTVSRIGRYEILKTLGRGAMGVVYLARDPIIDREVALKTLRVDVAAEQADEFRERFLREARAAGRLGHPGIVTVHDVGEDTASGVVFIAMEFIRGRDLRELLADGVRLHPAEAARIGADVALALDYAHSMGVVHRDIKPANIILTQDGTAKIMDFGVARLESSNLTVEGQFIGTPNYMSPEQITGRPVDGRSDIFSLGVVLFNLLTGERPFAGETMHEVTRKIVDQQCPIPSTVSAGLPPAFNPVVLRCLEKDPERRFQTAGELGRVLDAVARSLSAAERTSGRRSSAGRPELETRARMAERVRSTVEEVSRDRPESVTTRAGRRMVAPVLDRLRALRPEQLPLPDVLRREVNPRWALAVVGGWLLLWVVVLAALYAARDRGPFPAPVGATTANLHRVAGELARARGWLADGDIARAQAALSTVLDQAPTSTAARRLMAELERRQDEMRADSRAAERVVELVAEGRRLFRQERYEEAAERFVEALELDPASELAASYLDLARERGRTTASVPGRAVRPPTQPARPGPSSRREARPQPTPGRCRVTVFFRSPLSAGAVVVTVRGVTRQEIPFDFTEKAFFGLRTRKGTGTVKDVFTVPSGEQTLTAELVDAERGSLGTATFRRELEAGSDWSLRIDLPDRDATPSFFLVQSSR